MSSKVVLVGVQLCVAQEASEKSSRCKHAAVRRWTEVQKRMGRAILREGLHHACTGGGVTMAEQHCNGPYV